VTLPFTFIASLFGSLKWRQRLGRGHETAGGRPVDIWLHASSMGEVKVLSILIDRLKKIDCNLRLHLTVMTDSGYNKARELLDDKTSVGFLPLDYRASIRRFLQTVQPDGAVFIETEIWPNIIRTLGRRNIPIFLANGRLSEKAYKRYRLFRSGMKRLFTDYTYMMVQSDQDRDKFLGLGADQDQVEVAGNMKFDAPIVQMPEEKKERLLQSFPFDSETKIFIAGSTRNGENEIILDSYKKLLPDFPDIRLILVPRHLERVDSIIKMTVERGLEHCLYSEMAKNTKNEQNKKTGADCKVLIVDKIGVLNDLYHLSDIAFVGGTLVDIGGHNILEPVWAGIPVLYGPSIANVIDSSEYILSENFGAIIENGGQLEKKLVAFFSGKLEYSRKSSVTEESSRLNFTAKMILEDIKHHAKNLAENNQY